jgi:hypothetical protein
LTPAGWSIAEGEDPLGLLDHEYQTCQGVGTAGVAVTVTASLLIVFEVAMDPGPLAQWDRCHSLRPRGYPDRVDVVNSAAAQSVQACALAILNRALLQVAASTLL